MATTRTPASNEQRPAEAPPITRSSRLSCIALAGGIAACGPPQRLAPATPSATEPQTEGQPPPSSETLVAPPVTPPGVRAKLVGQQGATRTYQLVLTPGTEVVAAISDFVLQNHIEAASFHGLGACTDAVLAYYDPLTHAYQKTAYKQQMEIVSLIGGLCGRDDARGASLRGARIADARTRPDGVAGRSASRVRRDVQGLVAGSMKTADLAARLC
jgi:hypothetical protein